MKRLGLILCIFFMFPIAAQAEDIQAFVDRNQLALGESLQLTVSISGAQGGSVDVSPIQDFKVISRGQSSSVQIINGQMSQEISYNYTLIPSKQGKLKIPALAVDAGGKSYHTQEIMVQVSDRPQLSRSETKDIFVRAEVSNPNPYEGEQIIYTFKFFRAIQVANAKFEKPDFSGFTSKPIDEEKTYRTNISGRQYLVTVLKYVLIPVNAGEKVIEPAVLNGDLVFRHQNRSRSMFDSFFDDSFFGRNQLESRSLSTKSITVNVKPLPPRDHLNFSGLVGQFDIQAEIESTELNAGDSTTLSLIIQGTGNIMDAGTPEIHISEEAFKVYKDNPQDDILLDSKGYSGKKIFRTAIVPIKPGDYTLGPVQFTYFDIAKNSYQTKTTRYFSLKVNPSPEKETFEAVSPVPVQQTRSLKKKVEFTGRDILPLKEELDALENQTSLSLMGFILLLLVPGCFCLLVKAVLMFTQKPDDPTSIMADRAEKALKDACQIEASKEEFLSCLHRALISAILSKAGTKGESLTYAEAENILKSSGYSEATAADAASLLEKIESTQYSGLDMDKTVKDTLLSETRLFIKQLSK